MQLKWCFYPESFGQVTKSCFTGVDERPYSIVNLGSVNVDFIMCSLNVGTVTEYGLIFISCDHTFAYPFNKDVPLRIVFMCSGRKAWFLHGRPIPLWSLQRRIPVVLISKVGNLVKLNLKSFGYSVILHCDMCYLYIILSCKFVT